MSSYLIVLSFSLGGSKKEMAMALVWQPGKGCDAVRVSVVAMATLVRTTKYNNMHKCTRKSPLNSHPIVMFFGSKTLTHSDEINIEWRVS